MYSIALIYVRRSYSSHVNVLSLELGVIGGLITSVRSLMLSWSLPVYQVRLDWLPLSCIALI